MISFKKPKALKIRLYGDAALATKAKNVEQVNDDLVALASAMIDCMHDSDGIGLAATQVGILQRFVVLDVAPPVDPDGNPAPLNTPGEQQLYPKMPLALVNPEIVSFGAETNCHEEGCLSVPKLYATVERPSSIVLKTHLLDGSSLVVECGGFLARAIQHELDHLDGIVYVQRVKSPEFEEILPRIQKIIKKSGQKNFRVKRLVDTSEKD